MSDYNKQTVAQLRQLLKDRSIPSTGLTRKAQIVEKLEEWDAKSEPTPPAEEAGIVEEEKAAVGDAPVAELHEKTEDAPTSDVGAETTEQVETDMRITAEEKDEEDVTQPPLAPEPEDRLMPDTDMTEELSAPHPTSDTIPPPAPQPQSTLPPMTTKLTTESSPADITRTPSSAPDEKTSIEKEVLLPIPERSATTTEEGTRLNTEELETDTRKRKRRSLTPDLPTQDVNLRTKRMRPSDGVPDVILKEDDGKEGVDMDTVMEQRAPEVEKNVDVNAVEDAENEHVKIEADGKTTEDASNADVQMEAETEAKSEAEVDTMHKDAKSPTPEAEDKPVSEKKDKAPRYKELFQPTSDTAAPAEEALQDDGPVSPALHPATPALYIRNFMRPLRPEALRAHLIQLATPPSSSPNPSILKSLFLDNMKTHALVLFTSTTAASRVRASLHGSIWPPEGNRKDLWVDFIPEDKVEDWIKEEEEALIQDKEARSSGRTAKAKKFEVVYEETENGGIEAVFQEIGTATASSSFNPPTGPGLRRASSHQQHVPPPAPDSDSAPAPALAPAPSMLHNISASFRTLDDLFSSTTAKPKLYFLPVSDDRAAARLRSLDEETSRDWTPEEKRKGRGIQRGWGDQKCRFGFDGDDRDRVIEVGGDFGPWADDSRGGGGGGGRGWKGGFGGGRGRGGRLG